MNNAELLATFTEKAAVIDAVMEADLAIVESPLLAQIIRHAIFQGENASAPCSPCWPQAWSGLRPPTRRGWPSLLSISTRPASCTTMSSTMPPYGAVLKPPTPSGAWSR